MRPPTYYLRTGTDGLFELSDPFDDEDAARTAAYADPRVVVHEDGGVVLIEVHADYTVSVIND